MSILTLAQYKEYKGINSDKQDTEYTALIGAVNSFITSYCNRTFTGSYNTDTVEYFDATEEELYPKEYPLKVVTSIEVSTDGGQTYPTTLNEYTDYILDERNSRIVSQIGKLVTTSYPINAIRVTYMGGYENMPPDLTLAAVTLVDYYVKEQYTPSKTLAGATMDNPIITDSTARLPAHIRRILEHYRSVSL